MYLDEWPDCAIKGCKNKCCLSLGSKYCWPHSSAGKSFYRLVRQFDAVPKNKPAIPIKEDEVIT